MVKLNLPIPDGPLVLTLASDDVRTYTAAGGQVDVDDDIAEHVLSVFPGGSIAQAKAPRSQGADQQ